MRRILFVILIFSLFGCENQFDNSGNKDPLYNFDAFRTELDRNYSFFNYVDFNLDSIYSEYRQQLDDNTTENELFQIFHNILNLFNDAHTNIYTPLGVGGNIAYFSAFRLNQIDEIQSYFETYNTSNRIFNYGELKDCDLGYINIRTFGEENSNYQKFDSLLKLFQVKKGLIIDVRSNQGGFISSVKEVTSYLSDSSVEVCKYRFKNGPNHEDFSSWINFKINPAGNGHSFTKPIAVLTNRMSYSATEWFVLSVAALPNVTIVGDTTGGGSAITLTRELPNGWFLRMSNTQTQLPDGRDFQFTGLYPDYPVWISKADASKNKDAILETAITLLSGN